MSCSKCSSVNLHHSEWKTTPVIADVTSYSHFINCSKELEAQV